MRAGSSSSTTGVRSGAAPLVLVAAAVLALACLPAARVDAVTAGDANKPDGTPWEPGFDEHSRSVFQSFDAAAVPPHARLAFENLKPSDRPAYFGIFLTLGSVLVPLSLLAVALARRRQIRVFLKETHFRRPDDIGSMAVIMGGALLFRVVAAIFLPLHGSEWGSVEHKPAASLPDIIFNGYEVLTNPPLLNVIEHFVFPLSSSPVAFRIPIVLFGLALVWGARCAGREMFSRRAGLIAAAFCAVNCGLIIWSATMRAYLPMMAFVVAALPAAYRLASGRGKDRDAVKLAVFGALAAWTHYIALIWLICLYALILWGRRRDIGGLARTLSAGLWTGLAFLPLVPFFLSDMGSKQASMMPPGYTMDLLAIATGMAAGIGILLPAGLVAARFFKSHAALWLSLLVCGYLIMNIATVGIIHWEVSYSVGLTAVVMLLTAGVVDGLGDPRAAVGVLLVLLASTSVVVASEPSGSPAVADAARPFLWRSVSNGMFAEMIAKKTGQGRDAGGNTIVLVTPAFESEPYLYHLGPVTAEQAGVEPVVGRNFDEMRFRGPGTAGRPARAYTVIGFERYWSWHLGQWPELDRYLGRFGSFWYARLQQNCSNGTGFTWSPWDCMWLQKNCRLVDSTTNDELYLCGADAG